MEEHNAGNAIAALKKSLAPRANVKRGGVWKAVAARELVVGDLVNLKLGDIVPADCVLLAGEPLEVDQSALTGESLPSTVHAGQTVYQGSIVKRGELEALVSATGANTFFGKATALVSSVEATGNFQKVLTRVSMFLIAVSLVLVTVILIYLLCNGSGFLDALSISVVILISSIPMAMQVVCSSTMAVGAHHLATKKAIVSRLSAIEELAGMDVLCSDKTGTLTQNKLTLYKPFLIGNVSEDELILTAALAAKRMEEGQDAIDSCVTKSCKDKSLLNRFKEHHFVPFDPISKRTEATVESPDGLVFQVSKGAPQVILAMSANMDLIQESVQHSVNEFAERGYRTLGVARTDDSGRWIMLGLLPLYDPPRIDTAETLRKAGKLGIGVKMITGDQSAIARETSRRLGMGTNIFNTDCFTESISAFEQSRLSDLIEQADGFAEVFPEHKFFIVEQLQLKGHRVGMTGDGVNDAPALKRADIGIAVDGATDAARAAADIVLTDPGLSVIIDAIVVARAIFQRMKNYCIYRIACTLQLLFFFFIAILAVDPNQFAPDHTLPVTNERFFRFPVIAIVVITVLNDGTILTIAYDHVFGGRKPEKWNLPETCVIASILGFVAFLSSILYLVAGLSSMNGNGVFNTWFNLDPLSYGQVITLMYLKVSLSDFMTVFAARTRGWFWERRPGTPLFIAFIVATCAATFTSLFWFLDPLQNSSEHPMASLSAGLVGLTWLYDLIWFMIQDSIKVFAYRFYDKRELMDDADLKHYTQTQKESFALRASIRGSVVDARASLLTKNSFVSAHHSIHGQSIHGHSFLDGKRSAAATPKTVPFRSFGEELLKKAI
eukprot:GILJ01006924.1.p1 GENE.GILJ01006924.1~~GILJ01006924.1.p1  ORF type:complete len:956 (+),score=175.50 GILJ01006924.1:359-2869(+)